MLWLIYIDGDGYLGSCTAEVEFEFTTWTWVQATVEMVMAVAHLVFYCLFKHANESWEKTTAGMVISGGCHGRLPFQWWPELKLRWWTQTLSRLEKKHWVPTQIQIPNSMATLYYAEHVHIAQTWTRIPTPYFCVGQESKFESIPKSKSGNVNEPFLKYLRFRLHLSLNGRTAIRRQNSHRITIHQIWRKLVEWPNDSSQSVTKQFESEWQNGNLATVLSLNCHSVVQTQTQTQTEPEAYRMHDKFKKILCGTSHLWECYILGIRPHECKTCKKTFMYKGALTVHMRDHTGKRSWILERKRKRFFLWSMSLQLSL